MATFSGHVHAMQHAGRACSTGSFEAQDAVHFLFLGREERVDRIKGFV